METIIKAHLNESILKDLALKDKHLHLEKTGLTGNVYLDKPWTVRYKETPIIINEKETLYKVYRAHALTHPNDIALFMPDTNEKLTNEELLSIVDKTAAGFKSIGLNSTSKIGVMLSNTVEEPAALLAASKIGATIHFLDFTKNNHIVKKTVEEGNFDILMMDEMLFPLEYLLNEIKLRNIVCNTRRVFRDNQHMSFKQLLAHGENIEVEPVPYSEDRKSVVIYSSGTTGAPKPIVHTESSVNSAAQKIFFSNYPLGKDTMLMKFIPPHIGLGLITTLYTGLISGSTVTLIRFASPEDSITNTIFFVKHYKKILSENNINPNNELVIFGAPMYFRAILNSQIVTDLSFVKGMLAAGSKMDKEELEVLDKIAADLGCSCEICDAYGQNEMGGAVSLNDNLSNQKGSAGYPVIGTDVAIIDPQNNEYLPLNQEGKIIERSSSSFLEYENMPEETKKSYIVLNDGSIWFDTHDIGYLSDDYHLYITGRTSRVIIKMDNKIPLDEIEIKIKKMPGIRNCGVIVTSTGGSFEQLTAFVEIDEDYPTQDPEELKMEIIESGILMPLEYPDEVEIVPNLPYLNGVKIDYQTLKNNWQSKQKIKKKTK